MTRYSDNNRKYKPREDTPIVASYNNTNESKELYCKWCSCLLHKIVDYGRNNTAFYCSNCSISYNDTNTDDLRSKSKIVVPDGTDNTKNPAVAFPPEPGLGRKKTEVKGGLKALSERGSIRITHYTESKG